MPDPPIIPSTALDMPTPLRPLPVCRSASSEAARIAARSHSNDARSREQDRLAVLGLSLDGGNGHYDHFRQWARPTRRCGASGGLTCCSPVQQICTNIKNAEYALAGPRARLNSASGGLDFRHSANLQ